nr:hypothetical protein CFP56_12921 [Quercus suber]
MLSLCRGIVYAFPMMTHPLFTLSPKKVEYRLLEGLNLDNRPMAEIQLSIALAHLCYLEDRMSSASRILVGLARTPRASLRSMLTDDLTKQLHSRTYTEADEVRTLEIKLLDAVRYCTSDLVMFRLCSTSDLVFLRHDVPLTLVSRSHRSGVLPIPSWSRKGRRTHVDRVRLSNARGRTPHRANRSCIAQSFRRFATSMWILLSVLVSAYRPVGHAREPDGTQRLE